MPKFSKTEQRIVDTLSRYKDKVFDGKKIKKLGKPRPTKGECKTDIYILLENDKGEEQEIKISVKQKNAHFLENKITAERAKEIFGENWKQEIIKYTKKLENEFSQTKIIFKEKEARTEKGSITLGWKFEISLKDRTLGAELPDKYLEEVFMGTGLSDSKKNAKVEGEIIENSGIAEYLLLNADNINLEDISVIFSSLIPIKEFITNEKTKPKIFYICTGHNRRTIPNGDENAKHKDDGNRPLCVYVDWHVKDNKLSHTLNFENPLNVKGNEIRDKLENTLKELKIKNTNDL